MNKVIIVVDGGCVCEVYCSDENAQIVLIDWDNIQAGDPPGHIKPKSIKELGSDIHKLLQKEGLES